MFSKYKRPDKNKLSVFGTPPHLAGGIFAFGKIGAAKSTTLLSLCQKYHDNPDRRYKIIDLHGGERKEELFWCFPSEDINYWSKLKRRLNFDKTGQKLYNVHILYPLFSKTIPNKLPSHPPRVRTSVFRIPFNSIEAEDINMVVGKLSETPQYFFNGLKEKLKTTDSSAEILFKSQKIFPAIKNSLLFKSFLEPLCNNHLLSSKNDPMNLNIIEELKDRETVTVLCLDFVPKEYHIFVMRWLMGQISKILDSGRNIPHTIGFIREAAEFFRATDQSLMPDRLKLFRGQLANFIRMGRKGFHLFLEAQSIRETRGMVDGSQDITLLCKMTSASDIEDATQVLYKSNLMRSDQISQLPTLNPGEIFFVQSGQKVKRRYFFLPRTMYWKPGYNFYKIWESLDGNYKSIIDDKERIISEAKEVLRELKGQAKKEKAEKKKKEEEKKAKMKEQKAMTKELQELRAKETAKRHREAKNLKKEEELKLEEQLEKNMMNLKEKNKTDLIQEWSEFG